MKSLKKIIITTLKIFKYLIFIALLAIIIIVIALNNVYGNFNKITQESLAGKKNIETAINAIQEKNWTLASHKTQEAQNNFNVTLEEINKTKTNIILKHKNILRQQVNDIEYLIKTAEILNCSMANAIPIIKETDYILNTQNTSFSELSESDKEKFIKLIYESEPELNELQANIKLALLNLDKIHKVGILNPVYDKISDFKTQLNEANNILQQVNKYPQLLPLLAGYPKKSTFLVILQNNDELRPSGGFIGLYAILETKNGSIVNLKSYDSYHIDMPAIGKWQKTPPREISKYLKIKNWYFRDSNWSPDWPQSAQNIVKIYNGERKAIGKQETKFDGVIAINPKLVSDLISLVGNLEVNGEIYTPENFQKLLQYNVEVAYQKQNISSWDRKEIVNKLIDQLEEKIMALPSKDWPKVLDIITDNINSKDIQIYFFDPNYEKIITQIGASGKIKRNGGDFFMVVDANLGAFKSDAVIDKNINYNITQKNDSLISNIKLNYNHTGTFDWRTTRYRSWTRIYIPLGSKVKEVKGVGKDYKVFDDKELNKTVIAFFWTIEPKTKKTVDITYQPPTEILTSIKQANYYELYVQKQSGNNSNINVNVNLDKLHYQWGTKLSSDTFFQFQLRGN